MCANHFHRETKVVFKSLAVLYSLEILNVNLDEMLIWNFSWLFRKIYWIPCKKHPISVTIFQTFATCATFALMLRKRSSWRNVQPSAQLERRNARPPSLEEGIFAPNVVSLRAQLQFDMLSLVKLIIPSKSHPLFSLNNPLLTCKNIIGIKLNLFKY